MSDEQTAIPEQEQPKQSGGGVLRTVVWASVGLICGAVGFTVPMLFPGLFGGSTAKETSVSQDAAKGSFRTTYIDFGETVVNINSDRLNRYLRTHITLLVRLSDKDRVEKLVQDNRATLKSWLISFLSDVSMEDIRGAAGQNRLRREIQDHFNSVLFPDGYDRIREVLFEEFNVQ